MSTPRTINERLEDCDAYAHNYPEDAAAAYRNLVTQLIADIATRDIVVRDNTLEECAKYIETQSLPDTYSEPCLHEFAADFRDMKGSKEVTKNK